MASVTIYYSRSDEDYADYDLYLIPGNNNTTGLLFPDITVINITATIHDKKCLSVLQVL